MIFYVKILKNIFYILLYIQKTYLSHFLLQKYVFLTNYYQIIVLF